MVLSRDFTSRICVVLENYQISQTEQNARMQTDNNVLIRLSTFSTLKDEIIFFGSRDLIHFKNRSSMRFLLPAKFLVP